MKKLLPVLLLTTLMSAKAQFFNPSGFIEGAQSDMNYLGGEYLSPFGKALGVGLNNGWYTTAKTHKVGRFDLMVTPTFVFVPNVDRTFTIDPAQLTELQLVDPNDNVSPTAAGSTANGPELEYSNQLANSRFTMPGGSGFNVLPFASAQLTVGLPFNTDVSVRYIPQIALTQDGPEIGLFGVALKHDVLQWIPGGKALPFSASVFAGYTKLDFMVPIDDATADGGDVTMSSTGYTIRGLISKKLLFLTFYGGVGYNSGLTNMNINGTYQYTDPQTGLSASIEDPVATTASTNGFIGQAGLRLKFLFIMCFSVDYTFGAYSSATAGLGFSVDF